MQDPALDEVDDPLLGRVIDGRFMIQSVLGKGGMGVVYRAHQSSLERSVALKVMMGLDPEREAEFQRRFFLEAATVAKLKHPNTITVFDFGSTDVDGRRLFFIAMELLEGVTLSRLIAQGRSLPPLRAVHIGMQICRSLREAHKAGVVHRDLKPGNIMIVRQDDVDDVEGDFVKVLDFGLAKVTPTSGRSGSDGARPIESMTKAGTFMGSPRYVAPEQVEGRAIDARADIYSFGCLLYRLLSGRVPFDGKNPVQIMLQHVNDPPPPLAVPGLPRTLTDLVMQCLEKIHSHRPGSMDEVLVRLKLARAELGGGAGGLIAVSDDRLSLVDGAAVSDPPQPIPGAVAAGIGAPPSQGGAARAPQTGSTPSARPQDAALQRRDPHLQNLADPPPAPPLLGGISTDPRMAGTETDWALGSLKPQLDDSTRPTRTFGHVSAMRRPPRRPWLALAAGAAMGVVGIVGVVAWRTSLLDPVVDGVIAALSPRASRPLLASEAGGPAPTHVPAGPLAAAARLRIATTPPGADVLEERNGLPRLLGVTPLTVEWNVAAEPTPRRFLLRKDGYLPASAKVPPPAATGAPVVSLDVDATLRPAPTR